MRVAAPHGDVSLSDNGRPVYTAQGEPILVHTKTFGDKKRGNGGNEEVIFAEMIDR